MYKLLYLIFALVTVACFTHKQNKVNIKYLRHKPSDSLSVKINFTRVAHISSLHVGLDTTLYYSPDLVKNGHDVVLYILLYEKGKLVDSFFDFNDLNYLSNEIDILVSDSMRIKYSYKQ